LKGKLKKKMFRPISEHVFMGKALSRVYSSFMIVLKLTKLTNNSKILKQKDHGIISQFQYKNDVVIFRSPFIELCSGNDYP
jgi:hypothetical protein